MFLWFPLFVWRQLQQVRRVGDVLNLGHDKPGCRFLLFKIIISPWSAECLLRTVTESINKVLYLS